MDTVMTPRPLQRYFLPKDFKLTVWSRLKPYYNDLLKRPINSVADLERWILDKSELDAFVGESFAWRYIKITLDSADERAAERYQYAVQELSPRIASFENLLNKKLVESPFVDDVDQEKYFTHLRNLRNSVALFQEENIPLSTEVQLKSKECGRIFSEMTVGFDGKQMTLQKAGALLEEPDRNRRESVYRKINNRILQDTEQLEVLFEELLKKRHQIATNARFENFRDYKFQALGRFDYTVDDCLDFHESIKYEILPIVDELNCYRQDNLKLEDLKPWDLNVDSSGKIPLRPFNDVQELIQRSIVCLRKLNPMFGEVIAIMDEMGHLDLESREKKRPGGYNMPLHMTGVPFIFMNAINSFADMRTLMHESGHAIHSYLTRDFRISTTKRFPSEVAELAAMTMELLTMDHWDVFFENPEDLKRAKIAQLENVLKVLPWIATIDKFQHWLYTHSNHSSEERKAEWVKINDSFTSNVINRKGLEAYSAYLWHKQLHIFEVPFYYIEYGMAQLGAIAIWKHYRENPQKAIEQYIEALKLGYTKPISEIYRAAGIEFDFSRPYIAQLGSFIKEELEKLIKPRLSKLKR